MGFLHGLHFLCLPDVPFVSGFGFSLGHVVAAGAVI